MGDLCYLCLAAPTRRRAPGYNFQVCESCWDGAARGWPEAFEPNILQALGRAGLLIPDRNDHGLYPREYAPPADFAL